MRETNNLFVGDEYHFRLGIFASNKRRIQEFNKVEHSYSVSLNKLACYTPSEYSTLLGHKSIRTNKKFATKPSKVNAPDAKDWRDDGIVNAVKDQGQCGSCWAFSVIQAQESQWALVKGELPSLSEQNLVDCCTYCYGCNGGDEYIAYDYVIQNQDGLWNTEEDYPYVAQDQNCQYDASKGCCKVVSYFRPTESQDEEALKESCGTSGVVSIAIDASGWDFQLYTSGIYNPSSCSSTSLDHAVGLVGYGSEDGTDYWIVRNSWGTSWGEDGYIRIIRNYGNKCGVATDVIIPQV